MTANIRISSLKIKFKEVLDIVDEAIEDRKIIEIPNEILKQKSNLSLFLKWLQKHKIIDLNPIIVIANKKSTIRSRFLKIQISLQLMILGSSINEIAKIFGVKLTTVKGYLNEIADYDQNYSLILKKALEIKGFTKNSPLNEFPIFPIRFKIEKIKDHLKSNEWDKFESYIKSGRWIKIITGKDLGTQDLSILFPKR